MRPFKLAVGHGLVVDTTEYDMHLLQTGRFLCAKIIDNTFKSSVTMYMAYTWHMLLKDILTFFVRYPSQKA